MWEQSTDFWTARDSWRDIVVARQAAAPRRKGGRFPIPRLTEQHRMWMLKGERYLKDYPGLFKAAGVQVAVDPALREAILRKIDSLAPAMAEAFDSALAPMMFKAWREWPVRSGLSKSLLNLEYYQVGDASFAARVGCAAPYTVFIKNSPAIRLIQLPASTAAAAIGAQVVR